MTSQTALLFLVTFIFFITICRAQERSPHGLAYESPLAFSPEAYEFFHPDTKGQSATGPCSVPDCSTLPVAATVQSTPANESTAPPEGDKKKLAARSLASIPTGLVFALLVGLGVYYVVINRRNNAARAKAAPLQPEV
ncbi:hypothetical protein M9H77_16105 [Catharanthus roseus]|uniref:Uncharacterized protein n=1 Tax=Catharanthus roseus TaxID=4058 RepID=A0ACC0AYZ4_CATRO|nr:hypothetical protein M9H77_16105 [Catharanthus roseus]